MDMMQKIMRVDLDDPLFEVRTPVVAMDKCETLELGLKLGVLEFLLEHTITCYEGIEHAGCGACPACELRNEGLRRFMERHAGFDCPFPVPD